jgi:hypothetical protein
MLGADAANRHRSRLQPPVGCFAIVVQYAISESAMRINSWPAYCALGLGLIEPWAGAALADKVPPRVGFHAARLDREGKILPWYSD